MAIRHADRVNARRSNSDDNIAVVFAREVSNEGRRYFVVEQRRTFYMKYMSMKCRDRTFYEILRPNHPCYLYFDIEFDKLLNPDRDGESALAIFKTFLAEKLFTILGLHLSDFIRDENGRFSGHY